MDKRLVHGIQVAFFDLIILNASFLIAFLLRYDFKWSLIDAAYISKWMNYALIDSIISVAVFYLFKMYNIVWRFISLHDSVNVCIGVTVETAINVTLSVLLDCRLPISVYIMSYVITLIGILGIRVTFRLWTSYTTQRLSLADGTTVKNVMVIGAGEAGRMIIKDIINTQKVSMIVRCVIDDNPNVKGKYIEGVPIVGARERIIPMVEKYSIDIILLAIPSASPQARKDVLEICKLTKCELRILPGMYQLVSGTLSVSSMRKVEVEDLLGREPIRVNTDEILGYVSQKTVMVTGGGGSIGSELCRQIASHSPKQLIILDIYENNAYDIQQELIRKYPQLDLKAVIASVRDRDKIDAVFKEFRPDIVFHAAAHKHVPLMEDAPCEAIKNNVFGTYNVAQAAIKYEAKKFVLISTDKAVNPTNIMGASKRLCEMVMQMLSRTTDKTSLAAVRFGNVLGSNGSVIPLFKKQIEEGGPVTVTHPDIIRFFMTIPEAVSLVLQAGAYAKAGEIFILNMGAPVKIDDLARNLIRLSGYTPDVDMEIKYTGLRPGEKLYEELLMDEEGKKNTQNNLIYIGKPIEMDDEQFKESLKLLYEKAYQNVEEMKDIVAEIVPTYKRMADRS